VSDWGAPPTPAPAPPLRTAGAGPPTPFLPWGALLSPGRGTAAAAAAATAAAPGGGGGGSTTGTGAGFLTGWWSRVTGGGGSRGAGGAGGNHGSNNNGGNNGSGNNGGGGGGAARGDNGGAGDDRDWAAAVGGSGVRARSEWVRLWTTRQAAVQTLEPAVAPPAHKAHWWVWVAEVGWHVVPVPGVTFAALSAAVGGVIWEASGGGVTAASAAAVASWLFVLLTLSWWAAATGLAVMLARGTWGVVDAYALVHGKLAPVLRLTGQASAWLRAPIASTVVTEVLQPCATLLGALGWAPRLTGPRGLLAPTRAVTPLYALATLAIAALAATRMMAAPDTVDEPQGDTSPATPAWLWWLINCGDTCGVWWQEVSAHTVAAARASLVAAPLLLLVCLVSTQSPSPHAVVVQRAVPDDQPLRATAATERWRIDLEVVSPPPQYRMTAAFKNRAALQLVCKPAWRLLVLLTLAAVRIGGGGDVHMG
jgi:hypothetical protein